MVIGKRLKAIREEKQMSQGDVEKRTGLLRCYLSRIENGWTIPSIETLEKWSKALEVPLYQLFYDGENPKPLVIKNGHTPKMNRTVENHLRRVEAAFARMQPRDIAIVSGLALKFAARR